MPVMLPPGAVPRSPPPAAALFGQGAQLPAVPQPGGGPDLRPGEAILPAQPTNPAGYMPNWPAQPPQQQQQFQQPAAPQYPPQQFAPQPFMPQPQLPAQMQYPQPPSTYQQPYLAQQPVAPPAPQAPAPQPNIQQYTMPPDALRGAGVPYQFNDGLQLGGLTAGAPGVPSGAPAPAVLGGLPAASAPIAGVSPTAPVQPQFGAANTGLMAPASTALRDSLASQGLPVAQYPNDQALLDDMGQTVGQIQQLRQMARLGWESQQQQPPAQPTPQAPAQGQLPAPATVPPQKAVKPEWRQEWSSYVKKDPATGRFVPIDGYVNPLVAERANQFADWERSRAEELVNSGLTVTEFEARLPEIIKQARTEARQEIEREEQTRQGQAQVQSFLDTHKAAFFQLDPSGQPIRNPVTGQPITTAIGQAAFAYGNQYAQQFAQQYGVEPHPAQVVEYVQLKLTADQAAGRLPVLPQPTAPQPPPTIDPQALKDQVLNQALARQQQIAMAAHYPNQGGTIATAAQQATQPQNPKVPFNQMLIQAAIAKGQLPPNYMPQYTY